MRRRRWLSHWRERELDDTRLYAPADGSSRTGSWSPATWPRRPSPVYTIALPTRSGCAPMCPRRNSAMSRWGCTPVDHRQLSRPNLSRLDRLSLPDGRIHPEDGGDARTAHARWSISSASMSATASGELRLGMPATVHIDLTQPPSKTQARSAGSAAMPPETDAGTRRCGSTTVRRKLSHAASASSRRLTASARRARRGAVTGLIGPDGAGKTTLMRLIAGLLRPIAGRIEVLGIDVATDPLEVQAAARLHAAALRALRGSQRRRRTSTSTPICRACRDRRGRTRYAELLHMTGLGPFTGAPGRPPVRRHEAEARPGLHAGAPARAAAAGRADRGRRSGVAARAVGRSSTT